MTINFETLLVQSYKKNLKNLIHLQKYLFFREFFLSIFGKSKSYL